MTTLVIIFIAILAPLSIAILASDNRRGLKDWE